MEHRLTVTEAEREGAWSRLPKEGTVRNIGILDIFKSKKTGFAEVFTVWYERKNKVKCGFKVFNLEKLGRQAWRIKLGILYWMCYF